MGGKRPDQFRITPDEAGATDYKTLPDDDIEAYRRDKRRYRRGRKQEMEAQPIPPDVLEPEAEAARAEMERKAESHEPPAGGGR
jgi:hypothetical protein